MKKLWLALFLFFPLKLQAALTDPEVVQEKTYFIHYSTTVNANTTAAFDLISLSTTPGLFPHSERGEIDISHINITVDKLAASTGTVKLGVVNFVNTSTGSVSFFYTPSFLKNASNTNVFPLNNFYQAFYRCKVLPTTSTTNKDQDGTTPFILTSDKRQGSTIYQNDTPLSSPLGTASPNAGDIVMEVINNDNANTITINVDIGYHSER